ncbi:MAG TPA: hypothetical protein VLV50_08625 [Stellaceae bacterium]|nr:hypothetical protein [Stellaceae bacterium]
MELLVPSAAALAGWAGAAFAALAFLGLGRFVALGRAAPEAALVAGWGVASLVLTLWGVATTASMRPLAVALAALGIVMLAVPRFRLGAEDWRALGKIALVALPLFVILASARPSEPDTFLNILPNAAYLHDHGYFPGPGRPADASYLPVAPYNLQIAGYVAGLLTPGFPANALIAFNFVLVLAMALFLARLVEGRGENATAPSWGAAALGLLLATALNPGFVPRYDLPGYGELPEAAALGFAAWFVVRVSAAREPGPSLALLAGSLAALVETKQDGVALALAVLAGGAALALAEGAGARARIARLAAAAAPAAVLFAAWRWYVASHLPEGELVFRAPSLWLTDALPAMLASMGHAAIEKFPFYGLLVLAVAAAAWRARPRGWDVAARMGVLTGAVFVLYSAALVVAYLGVMSAAMAVDAHSYFRYSTHLSLLLMAAVVLLLRERWPALWTERRAVAAGCLVLVVVLPPAFLRFLRFDLEPPDLRVWELARNAAPLLNDHERVGLVLPGDNGSVAAMLGVALRDTGVRRPDLDLRAVTDAEPATLDRLAADGYTTAILSCTAEGNAALLKHDAQGWHTEANWLYAPVRPGRWSHVLAYGPLCLG